MKLNPLLILSLLFLFNSCAQLSFLQDAKTQGKNGAHIGATLSGYGAEDPNDDFFENVVVPHAILHGSFGIADKADVQFSLSSSANFYMGGKFQFIGDQESKFAAAVLPAVEFQYGAGDDVGFFRPHLAVISSFHPNENFSIFLEPKFIGQFIEDSKFVFPGASMGIKFEISERFDLSLGGSLFKIIPTDEVDGGNVQDGTLYKGGIGLFFDL